MNNNINNCENCKKLSQELISKDKKLSILEKNIFFIKSNSIQSSDLIKSYIQIKSERDNLLSENESLKSITKDNNLDYNFKILKQKYLTQKQEYERLILINKQTENLLEQIKNSSNESDKKKIETKYKRELSEKDKIINQKNNEIQYLENSKKNEIETSDLNINNYYFDEGIDYNKIYKENIFLTNEYQKYKEKYMLMKYKYKQFKKNLKLFFKLLNNNNNNLLEDNNQNNNNNKKINLIEENNNSFNEKNFLEKKRKETLSSIYEKDLIYENKLLDESEEFFNNDFIQNNKNEIINNNNEIINNNNEIKINCKEKIKKCENNNEKKKRGRPLKKKISKIQKNKENDEKQINENIQTIEETKKNIINKSKNNENLNIENNNLNLKEPLQLTKQVSQHIDPILIKKPTDISELLNNYFTKSKNKNDNLKLEEINNILNNKTNTEKIIIIFDVIKNTLYKKEKIKHFLEFYFSLNKNNLEKININFFENLNLNIKFFENKIKYFYEIIKIIYDNSFEVSEISKFFYNLPDLINNKKILAKIFKKIKNNFDFKTDKNYINLKQQKNLENIENKNNFYFCNFFHNLIISKEIFVIILEIYSNDDLSSDEISNLLITKIKEIFDSINNEEEYKINLNNLTILQIFQILKISFNLRDNEFIFNKIFIEILWDIFQKNIGYKKFLSIYFSSYIFYNFFKKEKKIDEYSMKIFSWLFAIYNPNDENKCLIKIYDKLAALSWLINTNFFNTFENPKNNLKEILNNMIINGENELWPIDFKEVIIKNKYL